MSRIIVAQYDFQTKSAFDSGNTEGLDLVFGPELCMFAPFSYDEQLKFVRKEKKNGLDALVFANHGAMGLRFARKLPKSLKEKSILVFQSADLRDYFHNQKNPLIGNVTFEEAYALAGIRNFTFYEEMVDYVKKFVEERK